MLHPGLTLTTYTRLGDRVFPVVGLRLWKCLPSNLRQSDLTFISSAGR